MMREDKQIFAVSFAQKEKNGSIVGKNNIYWEKGFFQHKKAGDLKPGINGWAEGGSCMLNKNIYKEIGGFDSLFAPFYWEDIDLSYRAWKVGYEILFNPEIIVTHHHESTIGKYFSPASIKSVAYRNQCIFIWKNIEDSSLLLSNVARLLFSLPIMMFKDISYVKGFWSALLLLPKILRERTHSKISDKEILNMFI